MTNTTQPEVTQADRDLYRTLIELPFRNMARKGLGEELVNGPELLARHRLSHDTPASDQEPVASRPARFTAEDIEAASRETERLQSELDITNPDHIALWLEANLPEASLGYLALRIVEAHEALSSTMIPTPSDRNAVLEEPSVVELREMLSLAVKKEDGCTIFDHTPEEIGLHVMENWEAVLAALRTEPNCPSCDGLNTSCPDGCGRDPDTGELNGTRLEPADRNAVLEEALKVTIRRDVFDFLMGTGALGGYYFGDRRPDKKGAFWWREYLRTEPAAQVEGEGE